MDIEFLLKNQRRAWSQEDKEVLMHGLHEFTRDENYIRPRDKFYAIAHYLMEDKFTPKEVGSAIRKIVRRSDGWKAVSCNVRCFTDHPSSSL